MPICENCVRQATCRCDVEPGNVYRCDRCCDHVKQRPCDPILAFDRIEVIPGAIGISSVLKLRQDISSAWFSVDCHAKNSEVVDSCPCDGYWKIVFDTGPETRNLDYSRYGKFTEIHFYGFDSSWRVFTEAGRYNVEVIFIKSVKPEDMKEVWCDQSTREEEVEAGTGSDRPGDS